MLSVLSRFLGLRPLTALKTSRTVSSHADLPLGSNVFTFSVKLSTVETPRVGRTYKKEAGPGIFERGVPNCDYNTREYLDSSLNILFSPKGNLSSRYAEMAWP